MRRPLDAARSLVGTGWSALAAGLSLLRSMRMWLTVPIIHLYGMLPVSVRLRVVLTILLPLLGLAQAFAMARYIWCIGVNPVRAWQIALAEDRQANVAANGDGRETISSRANRARTEGKRWGCVLCRLLDAIQPNHCQNSSGQ